MAGEFERLVSTLNYGETADDLDTRLAQVLAGVKEHNKKGRLILQLDFEPTGTNQVTISDGIKAVVPEKDRPTTLTFWRKSAKPELTQRDPRQPELPDMAAAIESAGEVIRAGE